MEPTSTFGFGSALQSTPVHANKDYVVEPDTLSIRQITITPWSFFVPLLNCNCRGSRGQGILKY